MSTSVAFSEFYESGNVLSLHCGGSAYTDLVFKLRHEHFQTLMANLHHTSGKICQVRKFGLEVRVNLALREVRLPDVKFRATREP